ncbi:hypothetical protein SAMN05421664_1317 [Chryseobacterium soldanellicola]|uniref:Uncharacterized protein n=1 Tax=Chryseobacterium soldanellicola TaxID=311333 RepID=A0A1H1A9C9_9FLAO|nr:hypothetical protein SAMN05421664_1317 [Chryseobacterium soldanellicola]
MLLKRKKYPYLCVNQTVSGSLEIAFVVYTVTIYAIKNHQRKIPS